MSKDKVVFEMRRAAMYSWECDMCDWGEVANVDHAEVTKYLKKHMEIYHGVHVDEVMVPA